MSPFAQVPPKFFPVPDDKTIGRLALEQVDGTSEDCVACISTGHTSAGDVFTRSVLLAL